MDTTCLSSDSALNWQQLERIAPTLRLLSHPLRLRILNFLGSEPTSQRVTEIVAAVEGSQQAVISQQLKVLREAGVLEAQRKGNCVYYRICDPSVEALLGVIHACSDQTSSLN